MLGQGTPRIVVVGGGPTGLGAAVRLTELGHENWHLYECNDVPGGLSRSFVDEKGFTWDLGGHVIFSHYQYFDDVMDWAVQDWNVLERESWVWARGRWVPYPFQNNIHRLPEPDMKRCFDELVKSQAQAHTEPPRNFEESFTRQFGEGIADVFMRPYNFKVWAVPPRLMSTEWVGERVATVNVERIRQNIRENRDDVGWGPNATFRFPQRGGTGGIYQAIREKLPSERTTFGEGFKMTAIDADAKTITFSNGEVVSYDYLISTTPYSDLLRMTKGTGFTNYEEWPAIADKMVYSSTNVIGIGLKGTPPPQLRTACWLYFPEDTSPFYRATVFSNYSKYNAPEGHWSIMLEVSESSYKPVNHESLIDDCIAGCLASDLLSPDDVIVSKWHYRIEKGYPTPFIGRNDLLEKALPQLRSRGIYSRGRFGAWRYEVGNQDHSLMQGVEAVNHALGLASDEITVTNPCKVNSTRASTSFKLLEKKM
ncbi:UDP-galactopyranose mutase [Trypanosoma rangeli]|uniref:UDP-galactopyranose mutase n=1 Tax=Trypanosoma rangeli TaxID=5698 RepID=A0A422NWN4_TRYRA|nr:UDP-galactopyranose mutase [Trypanosoma rangeli]RNF09855.1 UDP-galactopyranose mutase [Trypanosoma rangeli]|eukprot:RNF09855.1 UDP-galactopyranose mutase [Trypanosoma rangeli]